MEEASWIVLIDYKMAAEHFFLPFLYFIPVILTLFQVKISFDVEC